MFILSLGIRYVSLNGKCKQRGSDQLEVYWGLYQLWRYWLSKYSGQLKTGKMLHSDRFSFMSLHGIQNLCLHSRIIHKNNLCLHDTHQKIAVVYTISRPIFWNSNIIIPECLFGLSGIEGEFLGLGLWYIVKKSRYLLLIRHHDKKTGQVTASFSLRSSHSLLSVKF